MKKDQEQDQFAGQLPGTGGDYIDTQDVEGHRAIRATEEQVFGGRHLTDEGLAKRDHVTDADDDVEGHRAIRAQGGESELIKGAPRDNPHGER